jgi:hypothetical protein
MAEIVQSLFGVTPESYQQAQQERADAQALRFAQLTPFQQANFAIGRGANMLGGAIGGALGGQDPELQRITRRQQIAGSLNPNDLSTFEQAFNALAPTDPQGAMMVRAELERVQMARAKLASENALTGQREAAQQSSLATAAKTQLSIDQENKLRGELSNLGPNATEEQIRGVLLKYGDPDKVLTALTSAATRAEDRASRERLAKDAADARVEAARIQAEARVDAAREAGANRAQIAQLQTQNRQDLAQLTASLKGPSPAVIKAQEKAAQVEEGQLALGDTISTAKTLIADLAKMGGITSTSKGPLANLITSAQTGTVGQAVGRAVGTKEQAKRDELKSIRLQLLNAVKEATGMSAQQLNSNVELKTYLDSLGSEGMSKEANEAILDNLSRRYLKGAAAAPRKGMADPLGIR